jgi:excisionase family DNA binding protein
MIRDRDLSLKEVAHELSCKPVTVRRALRQGKIQGYRIGDAGNWRVSPDEVERVRRGLRRSADLPAVGRRT